MSDAPKLRTVHGRLICAAHYLATGPALYHTPQCWKCEAIKEKLIAEGKPLKKDATTMTTRERMRRNYHDTLIGHSSAEQLAEARARGWASLGASHG